MGYSHVLASSQTADPSVWCGSAINRSLEISLVDGNLKYQQLFPTEEASCHKLFSLNH